MGSVAYHPLIGSIYHLYTTYILGGYISPIPPIKGTRNSYWPGGSSLREKKFQGLIADFAHIPWEDTPNFQKKTPHNWQWKEIPSYFPEGVKRDPTNVSSRGMWVCDTTRSWKDWLIETNDFKPWASKHRTWEMVSWNLLPWKLTCPLKIDGWKMYSLLEWSLFRGHVSFQGCKYYAFRFGDWLDTPDGSSAEKKWRLIPRASENLGFKFCVWPFRTSKPVPLSENRKKQRRKAPRNFVLASSTYTYPTPPKRNPSKRRNKALSSGSYIYHSHTMYDRFTYMNRWFVW